MTATDDWLKSIGKTQGARVGVALSADPRSPDDLAEQGRISQELGLPPVVVGSDPEAFKARAEQKRLTDTLANAPLTAKWLADMNNGGLAKDDVDNLAWFETGFKNFAEVVGGNPVGRAIARGVGRVQAISPAMDAQITGVRVGDLNKTAEQIYQEELKRLGPGADAGMRNTARESAQIRFEAIQDMTQEDQAKLLLRGGTALSDARALMDASSKIAFSEPATAFQAGLEKADNTLMGVLRAFADDPAGGAAFVAETAAETLPVLLGATATTLATRNPAMGVAVMTGGSFLTESSNSAMEFLAEKGVDLSTPEAAIAVLQDADLMREAADRGQTRGLVIALFDAVSGGVAGKALARSAAGDAVVQGIAQTLLGAGGEATAQAASGQDVSWRDIVVEGLAELATAPVEVGGVAGRGLVQSFSRATGAGKTAETLTAVDEKAAASKLKTRAPEKFREVMDNVLNGQFVYVPADDLVTLFQAKDTGFDPTEWGIDPLEFEEMTAAGGNVAIPMSVYASQISGTPDAEWFKQNATTSPDEMSLSEADRFNAEVRGFMEAAMIEADKARAADLESRASDVQVYDNFYSQLRAAGRTKDVAENEARVMSAFFRTMAERYGDDALDLSRRFGLTIRGPETEPMRRRGNLDIALNTLRSGKLPKPGQSLAEFVRARGGVQDTGGDFEAMGATDLISETRAQIAERRNAPTLVGMPEMGKGDTLDNIARAAIEAGYLPDVKDDTDQVRAVMDAIREEMAGRPTYRPGEDGDPTLNALAEELSRRGVDLSATNDEIMAALEADADGITYDQSGRAITDTPEFRAWFGDSKVVDAKGNPLVVYHGAPDVRGILKDGFVESPSRGSAFFFSDDRSVANTYADDRRALDYQNAEAQVIPLYLSIQNPMEIDAGRAKWRETEKHIAEARAGGHDGLIIRNSRDEYNNTKDGGKVSTVYVAFNPRQAKSAMTENLRSRIDRMDIGGGPNRGTFDPNDPRILFQGEQTKRGSITLPSGGIENGETIIRLFETADLSTVIHESAHYWLEVFNTLAADPDAPQQMRDDMDAIRRFVGAEAGKPIATASHEAWARGVEAYMLEGKAPSLELADAFSRFKAWLTRIYKTVRGLNVKLSPEIREVMDRMLATDAEIAAARDAQRMKPLFTDEAAAGMTPAAFQTYQRMARRATETASQRLLEATMAKVRREREAWWKAERADVRKEVEAATNSQREYRLTEMMANQRWLGDAARDVPDIRLDRAELVEMFGPGVLAEISRERLGGKRAIYAEGGASLMEVADLFGFANPQEMVNTLQNAGKRIDAIERETDRIMLDRYGDPLTDGTIEQEALEAIHSEQQAKSVATEVRHLASRAGLSTRNLTAQVFRQRAKLMLGRMSVAEATRPDSYLAAERKAAKRAEDAFARVARGGGQEALVAAARHKEQQLLNHYLYLESRDLAKEVDRGREKMRDYAKATVRAKLEGGYIEQIDALLDQYDFRVRAPGQIKRDENLRGFVERMTAAGRAGELAIDPRLIEQAKKVHYSRLSVDELRGLFDTIANIDHLGRFKQKLIEAKRKRDLDASVGVIVESVAKNVGSGKSGATGPVRNTFNRLFTMDTMLIEYDGLAEMGPVYEEVKAGIDAGATVEEQMQMELAGKLDEVFGIYTAKEITAMQKPVAVEGANGRPWAKSEILAVALNMGNEANRQRLFDKNVHPKNRLTPEQADALMATLDARDWQFVKAYADLINSYWPQLSEVSERRTGVKPKKVEAVPFDTPAGQMPGWYFPIKYDSELSAIAARDEGSAWDDFLSSGWGARAEVNSGMTMARQKTGGGRALKLDLSVGIAHMKDTVRLIALSEAVDNSYRILNDNRVKQAFLDAGRGGDLDVWNLWLKDVAQGPVQHNDGFNTFARIVKNNFTLSRLAFNLKTVIMQSTGMAQSAAVIGKRNMIRGLNDYRKRPRELAAEVTAKSAFMNARKTTLDKDIYDFANDARLSSPLAGRFAKAKNAVARWGFAPMTYMQFYSVDMPTWLGAYRAELEKTGSEEKAMAFADRMVARAQDSGLMADRTAFGRGTLDKGIQQADFIRVFSTLGGYMMTKMNRGYIEARRGFKGVTEGETASDRFLAATDAAANLFLLYVVESLIMSMLYSLVFDDDEDEPEDYAKFIATETAMSVIGGIPFVRDVGTAFQGYGAGGVLSSVLELPADFYAQTAQGENDKALRRVLSDTIGVSTGLPTTAFMRALEQGLLGEEGSPAEAIFGSNPITR